MASSQKPINSFGKVRPYQGAEKEQLLKIERMAFLASALSVIGIPTAFLGFGLALGIAGLVLGIKAKRPNGTRPVGAIIAIAAGIICIPIGIVGCIVTYGWLYSEITGEQSKLVYNLLEPLRSINTSGNLII